MPATTNILTFLTNLTTNLLTNPTYTAPVADTSSNILANLPLLQQNAAHIASVTPTDGLLTVNVNALSSDQAILGKVTGGIGVSDTVANLTSALGTLTNNSGIVSVTGTDGTVNVNVGTFLVDQTGLDKITGGFMVSDTAANISANLDSLAAEPLLLSITITDSAPVGVNVGQLTSDASAIGKLHNADSTPYRLAVADTASAIQAGLGVLQVYNTNVSSITATAGVVTVSTSSFAANEAVLDKVTGGFNVSDTAAAVKSALPLLAADNNVASIIATDGPVSVSTATFSADQSALDKIVGGFSITDTASAVHAALPALANDNHLTSITATGGPITVATSELPADKPALDKIVGGFAISDTAAAVQAALPVIANDNAVTSITATNGVVTVSTGTFAANSSTLDKIVGGFNVSDTAAAVTAALPFLAADSHILSVTATGGPVSVSTASFAADRSVLDKIVGGFNISDTAAAVAAALPFLAADSHIVSVAATGGPVSVSTGTFAADQPLLDKIVGGFAVSDTAAAVTAALPALAVDSHILSVTATGGAVSVSTGTFAADQALLDKIVGGFAVSDTAAAVTAALPALAADSHILSVTATGGPVSVSTGTFAANQPLLDKIVGGFAVSDTAAAVAAALPALEADSHILSVTATGGPVSVSTGTFAANQPVLDKIVGGFNVSDTAAAVMAALPALAADSHILSVTGTGGAVSVSTATFTADRPLLDKLVGGFTVSDTGANIKATLPALASDGAITSITATDGPVSVTAAMQAADRPALDKIVGGYAVVDTAAAISAALAALAADGKITSITATDGPVFLAAQDYSADKPALDKLTSGYEVNQFRPGQFIDLTALPFKDSYEGVFAVDTGVLKILDTANSNSQVAQINFDASSPNASGVLLTLNSDGHGGTAIGLVPYPGITLQPGDIVITDIAGMHYTASVHHYSNGTFTGLNNLYYTATGADYTSYVSPTNGIEQFSVTGSNGMQDIVGSRDVNAITTAQAAGTGMVIVDLAAGTVTKGGAQLATIENIQIVQLGADPSIVKGMATGTALLYGGSGADTFIGEGGNDFIQGGTSTNFVFGGSGAELFFSNNGTDVMNGGSGANFMKAGAAASSVDTFYGHGGSDYVYGGGGTTTLSGGAGPEFMSGGSGLNTLIGSTASSGINVMAGTNGTDVFYAGAGVNLMYEGSGVDTFHGGAGTDAVAGGSGQSNVFGGSGTLFVNTGAGNQHVVAGTGKTVFNDTAAHMTAGRLDAIDNFQGADATQTHGTFINLAASAAGLTTFTSQNGGTVISTAVNGGQATIVVSNASVDAVKAQTHFVL